MDEVVPETQEEDYQPEPNIPSPATATPQQARAPETPAQAAAPDSTPHEETELPPLKDRQYSQATRWTQYEVLLLIDAKKACYEKCSSGVRGQTKSGIEKWQEVEDYL
jgi:hypothetical protein